MLLLAVLAVLTVFGASELLERTRDLVASDPEPTPTFGPGEAQPTLALVIFEEDDRDAGATRVLLLSYDRNRQQGTIVLVPTATVADVPGHGTLRLGETLAFADGGLVGTTLENLLGIRLDGVATVSDQGLAELFADLGLSEVEVRRELAVDGRIRFPAGRQTLDGPRLADYLTVRPAGETELESLPRVQQAMARLFDQLNDQPGLLDRMFADAAPQVETQRPELLRDLLAALATAQEAERLTTLTLPVTPLGTGPEESYRIDLERLVALVEDRLAAARATDGVGVGVRLQVLNGNGVPGIGQQVAERLVPAGYRVVLTGNADRFTYQTTRIVLQGDTPELRAVGRDIAERLGVGEIERAGAPQSVVDVTIVVGLDFPPDR